MSKPGLSRWQQAETDSAEVSVLAAGLGWSEALARALVRRGVHRMEEVDSFLHPRLSDFPDPFEMPGMQAAAERVWAALDGEECIVVYGDYDVDGITSTALMVRVLRDLGAKVQSYLPHRVDDGYGLSLAPVRHCIEELGAQLMITVDCGTGSRAEVAAAKEAGVDVIVTDHHSPSGERAEPLALINPRCTDLESWQVFAGVGVAFMLCFALIKTGRQLGRESAERLQLKPYMDLVAVGTVADIVPLKGYNRALVRAGLRQLEQTINAGLKGLLSVAGIEPPIDAQHIGFGIGPRLNASGRLGTAQTSLDLLLLNIPDQAMALAQELHETNRERREVEKETLEQAETLLEQEERGKDWCLVVAGEGWHPGVIGIVASRLMRQYYRPAIVIAIDEDGVGKASCRSIPAFNMVQGLEACSDVLTKYGGHHMAAGFEVPAASIDAFREKINQSAGEQMQEEDLVPFIEHDGEMDLGDLDLAFMEKLQSLRPFGAENPEPIWMFRGVQVLSSKVVGDRHLKLQLGSGSRSWGAIGFGLGEYQSIEGPIDILGTPIINRFRGRESVELRIHDLRKA